MSIGVLHGQTGGAVLAVKVVGGLQKPSNAKQGVIWVKTDQKITGWTMQVEEPTEPTEGMVWIVNLSPARLNALKKNGIWFTPTSAKQYSDGGWVKKTGEYYNSGQWVALFAATINVTYPAGSTCTATDGVTTLTAPDTSGTWACVVPNAGTWTVRGPDTWWTDTVVISKSGQVAEINISKFYHYNNGVFCDQFGHSEMKVPSSSGISYLSDRVRMTTKVDYANEIYVVIDKVPLDRFSKLTLTGTVSCNKGSGTVIGTIFVSKVANCSYKNAVAISTYNKTYVAEGTVYTITIDVSDLSGEYYIYAGTNTQGGSWATDRIMDVNEICGEC